MKRTSKRSPKAADEVREELRFDYSAARPNRFAKRFAEGSVAVVLDPDVAAVFQDSQSVNTLLRSVIAAVPGATPESTKRPKPSD